MDYDKIIKELTLDEKVALLAGKNNWETEDCNGKVPSIMMTDGPHGLRKMTSETAMEVNNAYPATCFPTACAIASSWDPDMSGLMARTIAAEAKKEKVSIVLGCGVNMKRSPLCGRNFEYFSEDPYLAGKLGASYVKNMQAEGVGTSVKHFAANSQETRRMTSNSQVDERALQEIYLRAFEIIVRESQPTTLMASYNRINGEYGCANRHNLVELLRDKWGFKGGVMSDWGATMNAVNCHKNGLTLEMPYGGEFHADKIKEAIKKGEYTEAELDECAKEVLRTMTSLYENLVDNYEVDYDKHHEIAREIEDNCAILLKNDGVLPISTSKKLIIVGELSEHMRIQGGGSSHIQITKTVNAIDTLKEAGYKVTYLQGYHTDISTIDSGLHVTALDYIKEHGKDEDTVILYFIGLNDATESEGFDRKNLNIPDNQVKLLKDVCDVADIPIVAITFAGAPMDYSWDKKVNAVLHMYLGGQAVANSVADLVSGKVAPSGRLAETIPDNIEDTPNLKYFGLPKDDVEYRESIFIGYRYYETFGVPVKYPFGYGLTYTSFEYSDLQVSSDSYSGGELKLSVKVRNTGAVAGKEVVQVYICPPKDNVIRAAKELKAFAKVELAAGEEKVVDITLDDRAFAIYCDDVKDFDLIAGDYKIAVGASVQDIKLTADVKVWGRDYFRNERELFPSYFADNKHGMDIPAEEFERLLGRPLSKLAERKRGDFDITCAFCDVSAVSLFGRIVAKIVKKIVRKMFKDVDENDTAYLMSYACIQEGALESLLAISGGSFTPKLVDMLVFAANKQHGKAIARAFKK